MPSKTRAASCVLALAALISGCAHTRREAPALTAKPNFAPPPVEATVLYDGANFDQWTDQSGDAPQWKKTGKAMEIIPKGKEAFAGERPKKVGIQTKKSYKDFLLHVEFLVPAGPEDNSGVYLQRRYEIQIHNSYGGRAHSNACAAIYKQKQPDYNACRPPGHWQSYDIVFRAARFRGAGDAAQKTENARVSVYHNSVLVQDNVEILGKTGNGDPEGPGPAPILLQDHSSKTRFRNVWIKPLDETAVQRALEAK